MKIPLVSVASILLATLAQPLAAAGADDVGLQLWSLRDTFKESVTAGLDKTKALGFKLVETAGNYDIGAEKLRAELQARGLQAVSAHFQADRLEKDMPGVIADAKTLGAIYVVLPWLPHKQFDLATGKAAAASFDKWGAALKAAGLQFAYHPHGYEFRPAGDGSGDTVFDVIVRTTNAANVAFEMDVFWVKHAGIDPAALLEKYPDRWKMVHVKDLRKGAVTGLSTGGAPPTDNVAVGAGQIDWPAVLASAKKIGVEHYFIEDESPAPLQNIPASMRYLKTLKF